MTLTIELAEADLARARAEGLDLAQIVREAAREAVAEALPPDPEALPSLPLPFA